MNLDQLQKKLLAAARANPPGDRVPYAFAKRIRAHLAALPVVDPWALWAPALWRAAAPCLALALLLGAWSFASRNPGPVAVEKVATENVSAEKVAGDNEGFSQHFERTMLAAVNENAAEEIW